MLDVIAYVFVDIVINIFHYHVQASAAPDQYWSTSTARALAGAPPPSTTAPYWQRTESGGGYRQLPAGPVRYVK